MSRSNSDKKSNILWNTFSSVKLTLVLLIILAITSIFGTVVPQQQEAIQFAQKLSPGLMRFFESLQLFDMYHSVWFRLLIGALALNLIICSLDRWPKTWRLFSSSPKPDRMRLFEDLPSDQCFDVNGKIEDISNSVKASLGGHFKRNETKTTNRGVFFYCEKGRYSHFGVYLVHFSVLLILIGGIFGSLFGFEAFVNLAEGETVNKVMLRDGRATKDLGFDLRCEKFIVEFYDNGAPKLFQSDLSFLRDGKTHLTGSLQVNHPITFQGITFYQSSYGTIPGNAVRVTVTEQDGQNRATFVAGLGESIKLTGNKGEFIVADIKPDFMRMGPAIRIVGRPPEGEEIAFWIFQEYDAIKNRFPGIFDQFPKLNPSSFSPFTFFLDEIESKYYTGLQVNRDPGVALVWTGCFAMVFGFFVTFFSSHRRFWVRVSAAKSRIRVSAAGRTNKNQIGLERELDQLVSRLHEAVG